MDEPRIENKYIDKLTVLRGFFAICVFLSHLKVPESISLKVSSFDLSFLFYPHGHMYVRLFFVLSGFLTSQGFLKGKYSHDRDGIKAFYIHRIRRIVPLYFTISAILLLTVYRNLLTSIEGLAAILRIFTFTYDINYIPKFSGPWWSLSFEMQFYLLCPFFVMLIARRKSKLKKLLCGTLILFTTFIFGVLLARYAPVIPDYTKHLIYYVIIFIYGILLNLIFQIIPKAQLSYRTANILFVSILCGLYVYISHTLYHGAIEHKDEIYYRWVYPSVICLIGGVLIYLAQMHPAHAKSLGVFKSGKLSMAKMLESLGILSFGFYLWHSEVVEFFRPILGGYLPYQVIVLGVVTFGISLALSIATYQAIEKQCV